MAFTPRSFNDILADMIAYVQANTEVSDFNPGSVIRTILEASAIEDDEQYYQMVQLLDMFSYTTASGDDLDRRLADFNLYRDPAKTATVTLRFFNKNIISSQASLDVAAAASSVKVFDISRFPTPSPSYTVRIGEGTSRVQDVTVTGVNYTTNTFTLSTPLLYTVAVGDRVSYVGTDTYSVLTGTAIVAPATVSESAKIFTTQEPAFILPGNYYSNEVTGRAQSTGTVGNVGSRRISQFSGAAPFQGAGVINLTAASGGRDRESDIDFRSRAVRQLQSLSRGTPLSLKNAALSVTDPVTGQRVVSANIIEDYAREEVVVYIDDGTGFVPDITTLPADALAGTIASGASVLTLNTAADFPSSGYVLILSAGSDVELCKYVARNSTTNTLTLNAVTTKNHTAGDIVLYIDLVSAAAELGQKRFRIKNFPTVRGTIRLFTDQGLGWAEFLEGTDFVLNKGTGEIQLTTGVASGTVLVAYYGYYINLIAEVQKVLEGQVDNPTTYPGYKASGIFLCVEAPNLKRITVNTVLSAADGYNEVDLAPLVQANIEEYINSLKIGDDVIRAKLIDVAYNVVGVRDVVISYPTGNVQVLENELPVAFDANGDSLVTVS